MSGNLRVVLILSAVFGIATGVYEFILPYLLRDYRISFQQIGLIFALAGLAMAIARVFLGGLSDRWGRKILYGWALALCGAAALATPLLPRLVWQVALKTIRETAALTRETLHPIVIYEERQAGFLGLIGRFRGVEYLLQAGGTLAAGLAIRSLGESRSTYEVTLYAAGGLLLAGALWWGVRFRERWQPARQRVVSARELFSLDLHPNLRLLAVAGIIFSFGMQISHSFYMPLFFSDRFGVSKATVSVIMVLHRLTLALPLLAVANLRLKNLRAWYIATMALEGLSMAGAALMPIFWLSAGVFLLHDFIGAGIWVPIQATLMQRYSRDATRGLEVGKVLAWGGIGAILGPLAAGALAERSVILPFLSSGVFMALAAIPLAWLNMRAPSPQPAPASAG